MLPAPAERTANGASGVPSSVWNLTADGNTVCLVSGCGHLEAASSGVLARQAAHDRDVHRIVCPDIWEPSEYTAEPTTVTMR